MAQERSSALTPQPALCIPQLSVVALRPESEADDPSVIYFPSCTRIKQCGGCCTHKLLECQLIETEIKTFVIIKSQYTGNMKMPLKEKIPVVVEEHTKCKCDCRIKESDCKRNQIYIKSQWNCECNNMDEHSKCLGETSFTTNPRQQTIVDQKRFISKPIPVDQSEDSKYQTDTK